MKRWAALLALAAMIAGIFTGMARAADLELAAPSSILMERATGEVLYEDNADERLRPASVTKVMTLLLVMEALEDGRIGWDDMVTTSAAAAGKGGSQIYLEENEQLPLEEMLKSVVVSSANDCACALAEHVAGSEAGMEAAELEENQSSMIEIEKIPPIEISLEQEQKQGEPAAAQAVSWMNGEKIWELQQRLASFYQVEADHVEVRMEP